MALCICCHEGAEEIGYLLVGIAFKEEHSSSSMCYEEAPQDGKAAAAEQAVNSLATFDVWE